MHVPEDKIPVRTISNQKKSVLARQISDVSIAELDMRAFREPETCKEQKLNLPF
jgi:hypothetical protein